MNNFTQRSRDRRTVSPLYQKMLMLLLLLVVGVSGVWAQTSYGKAEITSAPGASTGWQTISDIGNVKAWYNGTTTEFTNGAKEINNKWFVKLSGDGFIKIRVDKGAVVAGDILRVETIDIYQNNDQQNLGFKVEGSNGTVGIKENDNALHTLDYILKDGDIRTDPDEGTCDYIQINRNGNLGCGYHSVEILRPAGNVIKWTSGDIPTGCDAWYTLGDDATHHKESISGIASGTKVTLNATDAGNAHKIIDFWTFGSTNLYNNAAHREMTDWSHAVDGVLNLQPHFCDAYTMTAVKGDGCSTVSLKGTKDGNTTEINGIKQKSGDRYSLTFTATSEVGADFDGWYNGSSKVSGDNPYNYGEFSAGGTTDLTLTAKFKPANVVNVTVEPVGLAPEINIYFHSHHPGCVHGTGDNWGSIQNGKHIGDNTSIDVSVANVSGYNFVGWYENGVLKSTTQTDYNYGSVHNGCNLVAKFEAVSFDPTLSLNGTPDGNVVSYTDGVLTVKGGSNNVICVKNNLTGHANEYTGIRLTTQGKACRVIVRWGPDNATERSIKVIDEADKPTTSYYSWSMLGVPQGKASSISDIYFAGAQDWSYSETNTGVTTFSNASLVNVTETTPYTREIGEVREFNLNDTRVSLYNHGDHYQMGDWSFINDGKANIQWVYKSETNGQKYVTMKTTQTSNNMIEIFNSGHNIASYDGIHFDYEGQHFRVIAYKGDEKHVYTVPASTDKMTARFVTWADLGITDPAGLTRIEVAGCSDHDSEESVNFYGIRLYKSLKDVIYTDESVTVGEYNGNLTYKENHDGNNMSVVFKNIGDDRAGDCQGTIVRKDDTHGFTINAPACYKITKIRVGFGENSTSKVLFNNNNVDVNNQNQIEWTNNETTSSVTMTIPSDAANALHVKYVYYELEEIAIPSIEVNGQTRQYVVYAPDGITSSETSKVGVVFSLHGASNDYYEGRVDFDAIAREEMNTAKKFVVVYPRGLMRQLRGTERGWETYTESNTEDVEFFKAVVEKLKETYKVDMNRIYLAGFSNGGMMAYKAAHQAGDFFKAFASVGGYPVNESHLFHAGVQPTPFIHIQGKADTVFPDGTYPLNVIAHTMMFRNGADFNPAGDGNGVISPHLSNVEEDCHNAGEGGAAYYMYKVADMGHTWSYDWNNDGEDDIAETMWKFFTKPNLTSNLDETLKFRIYDTANFWNVVTTGQTGGVNVGYIGFEKPNGKTVLTYGGLTNKSTSSTTYDKDNNNKNLWHSLQFKGVGDGTPHYLKLNITTSGASTTDFFIIKLTKTGETTPVFLRRYQANSTNGDYYVNFNALSGWNEYKLTVERSRDNLDVKVNGVEFHTGTEQENQAYFPADIETVLSGMNPIYQPVFGKTYDGIAKEYLPFTTIKVGKYNYKVDLTPSETDETKKEYKTYDYTVLHDNLKVGDVPKASLSKSTTVDAGKLYGNIVTSGKAGEETSIKGKNAYVIGGSESDIDNNSFGVVGDGITCGRGLCLSAHGRSGMTEYLNGTTNDFPTHGVIAMKLQGTLDFTVLAQNMHETADARRMLKVYYTNDQLNGELKEMKLGDYYYWDFFGIRNEDRNNYGQQLSSGVRMQHLGSDGTCYVFITYEGRNGAASDYSEDNDDVWIKGIVIKRPDLKVTIGRTDDYGIEKDNEGNYVLNSDGSYKYRDDLSNEAKDNVKVTPFGLNKTYKWDFGTAGFSAHKYNEETHKYEEIKKVNKNDGRTYICGVTPDGKELTDHVLVFSDGQAGGDKAQFDGRKERNGRHEGFEDDETDNNEHIEFLHPTNYGDNEPEKLQLYTFDGKSFHTSRRAFVPFLSDGLKVNVTGSGWFSIACSAPEGDVKLQILSSTNGGNAYMNLLREFEVKQSTKTDDVKKETDWQTFRVYLKAHAEKDGTKGFWDGKYKKMDEAYAVEIPELDPEETQMSIYVAYSSTIPNAQLNIHYMQWANELPADYVFQREEDPALLNSLQTISNKVGEEEIEVEGETKKVPIEVPVLYWQAGNPDMWEGNNAQVPDVNGEDQPYPSAFNSGKNTPEDYIPGQDSGHGTASRALGGEWNVAAVPYTVAHTEASKNKTFTDATVYTPGDEFASPITGSFFRFMPMENQFISTWIVPEADANIYILDETGSPIPFLNGADTNGANRDKITQEARMRGWIHAATDKDSYEAGGNYITYDGTKAVRIDFAALAAKEYFICSTGGKIALARLNASGNAWRADMEEIPLVDGYSLILNDAGDNSGAIGNAMTRNNLGNGKYARYATKVKFNRALILGTWNPLVLPFSLNEEKFKEVFGDEALCLHFTKVDEKSKVITLTHHYYNMVVAGRPVFVLPDKSPSEITNVTLETSSVSPITSGSWSFTGSFDPQTMKKNDLYMTVDSKLKYLTKEASLGPLRSYISSPSESEFKGYAKAIFLNYDEEEENLPNGIEELVAAEFGEDAIVVTKSTKIYDINGRFVANGGDISNLPAGVYIVNGKKYVVK